MSQIADPCTTKLVAQVMPKMNRKTTGFSGLTLALSLLFSVKGLAQDAWSLQRCVAYALEQNLTIQQAKASYQLAELSERQAKAARLPSVNGNVNLGEQYGRTIDPTTNTFVNTGITFNSMSLNANVPLFTGWRIQRSIDAAKLDAQASQADLEHARNTLALQVAQAYLTVLLAEEQVANTQSQLALSQNQQKNTLQLIDAGNLPAGDRFNGMAQIARDEQAVIAAENNLELSYLTLKQLLQLEPEVQMVLEKPSVGTPSSDYEVLQLIDVYETATAAQPNLKAASFRVKGAERNVGVAKAAYYPTLSLFGNLSANYSSQFKTFAPTGAFDTVFQNILLNGSEIQVGFPQPQIGSSEIPYLKQLDQTFGQAVGLNLSIPIYQNGRTRLSVERAKLGVLNAQLQQNQVRQQLKNDIQVAIANVRSAKKQMEAAQKTLEASQLAFENAEKRYQIGASNAFERSTARNSFDIASNNLSVAKYDYLFKIKVLEFYLGKPIAPE